MPLSRIRPKSNNLKPTHSKNNQAQSISEELKEEGFSEQQQEVFRSVNTSRIVIPILIGVGVVLYILLQKIDLEEFKNIPWTGHVFAWMGAAIALVIIRHLAYAWRLRILTEGFFSWRKCIELIFIWEFSSTITPTSIGGSAVAFVALSQEKLSTAKTATIVTYTIVLDALFFVISLPILYLIFGNQMIGPNVERFATSKWGWVMLAIYALILTYGSLFAYGLFRNAKGLKRFFLWIASWRLMKRFEVQARQLGEEIVLASQEIRTKNRQYHLGGLLTTAIAWSSRFMLVGFLLVAFNTQLHMDFPLFALMYARLEAMFLVMLYIPTPGGVGFAELVFTPFNKDFLTDTSTGVTIAVIWRLMTYWSYLLLGVVIVPNWLKNIINERRRQRITTTGRQRDNE